MATKTETKPRCFIIMPITTPEITPGSHYCSDPEHFKDVLKFIFIPAVEAAGYKAIPPIAKGSELIHSDIIKHLESAEMVLCDMSCLNANVFFEWGVRTALNKPVCIVKDDQTGKVPFDINNLNHYQYSSALRLRDKDEEIEKLATHLKETAEASMNKNALWRHFGLSRVAELAEKTTSTVSPLEAKVELLISEVHSLKNRPKFIDIGNPEDAFPFVRTKLHQLGLTKLIRKFGVGPEGISIETEDMVPQIVIRKIVDAVQSHYTGRFLVNKTAFQHPAYR